MLQQKLWDDDAGIRRYYTTPQWPGWVVKTVTGYTIFYKRLALAVLAYPKLPVQGVDF